MRTTTLICLVFLSLHASSQRSLTITKGNNDTVYLTVPNTGIENMPVVAHNFKQKNIGNNGAGFNLYKAEPDNMIVAKPDANNNAKILNAIKPYQQITIENLNALHGKIDSVFAGYEKPYQFKIMPTVKDSALFKLKNLKLYAPE